MVIYFAMHVKTFSQGIRIGNSKTLGLHVYKVMANIKVCYCYLFVFNGSSKSYTVLGARSVLFIALHYAAMEN